MVQVINLTPHNIQIAPPEAFQGLEQNLKTRQWEAEALIEGENVRIIPSSGVARVQVQTVEAEPVDGISTSRPNYGEIEGLPEFQEGVFYVVSLLTISAAAAHGRTTADLLSPGVVVRQRENGSVILGAFNLNRA